MRLRAAVAVGLAALLACRAGAAPPSDTERLLAGVEAVERPGAPGALCVFGDDAFAVLTGDPDRPEPVVAAARADRGRVVAFAHDGYVAAQRLGEKSGAATLLANALRWASSREGRAKVAVLGGGPAHTTALRAAGFDPVDGADLSGRDAPDVVLVASPDAFAPRAAELGAWVRRGGGLVAGACPWGWEQVRGLPIRTEQPLNRFLATCGLVFADGIPEPTGGGKFAVAKSRPADVHAGEALRAIESKADGAGARAYLVEKALRSVPPGDTLFLPRAAKAAARVEPKSLPRPSHPLRAADDPMARLAVAWRSITWRDLAPGDVRAAPGADEFPGAPPRSAPRVSVERAFEPSPPGWRSTGLHLAPGEVLTVTEHATTGTAPAAPRWRIRIGCHADELWNLDTWNRWPEITHTVELSGGTTKVATPFGGLLYFEPPEGAQRLDVTISGAVAAPLFDLRDAKSAAEWTSRRDAPGPWAEIAGEHLVVTVPSAAVRELADPAAVAKFWDSVLAAHCALGGEAVPARPERFVCDTQISAGYMHSGYPIMMHLDVGEPDGGRPAHLVDVARLRREGSWGPFHELGHNRQKDDWTFDGTGEVTCNLFALHAGETLCGIPLWQNPWLEGQKANAERYLKAPSFAKWKSDPGIALVTYARFLREFGFGPLKRVFAESLAASEASRPKSDAAKIDAFVLSLSRATGRDLRPYFRRWGWPLSAAASADAVVGALPAWEPDLSDVRVRR